MIGEVPASLIENEKGDVTLPPERYKDYMQVKADCQAMIEADRPRLKRRAHIENVLNNNRPIDPAALEKKGLRWFPNTGYAELESYIQAQQSPLFDLVTEVDHVVEVQLDLKGVSKWEIEAKQAAFQTHYTWLMFKRWRKSFNFHFGMQQRELLVHGVAAHVRPHKNNWMCRTLRNGRVLFPEDCPLDFESEGERFMVREFVPAHVAYQWAKNEKTALALGWNPKAVLKTLAHASKRKSSNKDIEDTMSEMRRGDYGSSAARQSGFWINWLFCNELDTGKISQYAVAENYDPGDIGTDDRKGYLFKKRNRFDRWPLSLFTLDIGDGTLHGVRGYGVRTVHFFELSNRIKNAMVAQVLISVFPQFKQTGEAIDPDKLKLMRMGAMSIWPKGVEPQVIQFPPLNNGPLALSQELDRTLNRNSQPFTGSTPEPKDRETAYSFAMRNQDAARVSNGMQSWYESDLQQWHEKTIEALIATPKGSQPHQVMAEEFRERCRKDGVTDEDLKHIVQIDEVTSSGSGSAAQRLHGLTTLMQYVWPNTTEERKINIERDIVAATMGGAVVDRYARSVKDNELVTSDDSLAALESSTLAMGGDALISGAQNHVKHAADPLAKAQQLRQAVEEGQVQPMDAIGPLQKLLDHAGQHLDALQGNPMRKADFDSLSAQWEELAAFFKQLQAEAERMASEVPPEQEISENMQIGMAKVAADKEVKDRVADANIARKFRQTAFNERLADAKTAAQIRRTTRTQPAAAA